VSPARTVRLIAAREIRQRLRSRLFVWSTVVLSLLFTIGALLPALLGVFDRQPDPDAQVVDPLVIALVGDLDGTEVATLEAALGSLEFLTVADEAAAEAALIGAQADLAIIAGERVLAPPETGIFGFGSPRARRAAEALALVEVLSDAGASEAAGAVLDVQPLPVEVVGEVDEAEQVARMITANLGVVFLFAMLMFYASMIVNGIIEEKGSRVVELLVEAVPVRQLMAGKVLGLGAIAVGQMLVLFTPAVTVLVVANRDVIPPGIGRLVGLVVLWFLLGYAFYTLVSAGLGSLVSRPEEAQAVLTPATMLALLGYFVGFASIQAPDSPLAVVAGWLPPSAPFVMLVRQVLGTPTVAEVVGALVLMVAAIVGAGLVAARVYEGGILRVGARVRLRDAWRGAGA
jgi:ABC-2 type transport system permease protein